MDNARIADRLDAFAVLLELADANPYTARAYRRAAETIRAARAPVAELVGSGRVRELRGIGGGIEARLRELVETGDIAEVAELEREVAPGLVGLGRHLGVSAKRSIEIAHALGIRTPQELREAAAAGRLQTVPGIGPKTEARLLGALARAAEPRPRRGLLLDRASALLTTYFTLENPAAFEATHREMHLENDFAENIYLHGYVDRLDIAPTGEVRIVDYKTGKSPKPGWEEKALFQLRVYALLYWKNNGVLPRLLQLIYLGDGRLVKSNPTMSELESTERTLRRVAKDIFISTEKEFWPPKPSRLCDWCYFKKICPAHNN